MQREQLQEEHAQNERLHEALVLLKLPVFHQHETAHDTPDRPDDGTRRLTAEEFREEFVKVLDFTGMLTKDAELSDAQ
eukprot:SAG22_NODE_1213_length_5152_cov_3.185830_3_plen_78_part_00